MELVGVLPHMNGMARIWPAAVANHDIRVLREEIHQLSLSLVPPVRPHDHDRAHRPTPPNKKKG